MTTTIVPSVPAHSELVQFDVDNSISGRHMGEMINNTSFLLGKNVANVVCSYPAQVALSDIDLIPPNNITFFEANYQWFYTRSPDVQFVFLEIECWKSILYGEFTPYIMTLSASLPVGASYATPEDESSFRRNQVAMDQTGNINFPSTRTGIIDVSGLSTTVPSLFSLNISGSTSGLQPFIASAAPQSFRGGGISKINMQEIPQRFLNVSGLGQSGSSDIISVVPFRRIVDGDADQEFGLARILDQTKKAKTLVRNQWQIVNHQSTQPILHPIHLSGITAGNTTIWYNDTVGTSPVLFQIPSENLAGNVFYIRTRNYRGSDPTFNYTNAYTLYVRYRTALSPVPIPPFPFLQINYISEPNSLSATLTLDLPPSITWTTASIPIDFPCDEWIMQREQLVRLSFQAGVPTLGQVVYFSAFYLVENET
jgi:hypothetical protein